MDKVEMELWLKQSFQRWETQHKKMSEELINTLDFRKLEQIRQKPLSELNEEDLGFLELKKIQDDELDNLYSYRDFYGVKIYFNRQSDSFEKRGYALRKESDITSSEQLIEATLINWRLKMNRINRDYHFDNEEPVPF